MKLFTLSHPETHEILNNARAAHNNDEITDEDFNEIVKSCFAAEIEAAILGHYPETSFTDPAPAEDAAPEWVMGEGGLG